MLQPDKIIAFFFTGRGCMLCQDLCVHSLSDQSNRKKELLSREDLELSWRPLYELHDRILFSKTEHLGLNWFPKQASVLYGCCSALFNACFTIQLGSAMDLIGREIITTLKKSFFICFSFAPSVSIQAQQKLKVGFFVPGELHFSVLDHSSVIFEENRTIIFACWNFSRQKMEHNK